MEEREFFDAYIMNDYLSKPQLKLDIPLYRYRGNLKNVIDEITNDHIYFSPLEVLNDPFDSSAALSMEECKIITDSPVGFLHSFWWFSNATWYKDVEREIQYRSNESLTLEDFCKLLSKLLETKSIRYNPNYLIELYYSRAWCNIFKRSYGRRIACFSETWESSPMWSYYADSHKGVCLKYDFSILDRSNIHYDNLISSIHKVWYSNIRYSDSENSFSHYMKNIDWAHEQEWRIVTESTSGTLWKEESKSAPSLEKRGVLW